MSWWRTRPRRSSAPPQRAARARRPGAAPGREGGRPLAFLAVARLAFTEAFRRRLVAAVGALTLCFLALYGIALHLWAAAPAGAAAGGLLRAAAATGLALMGLYVARGLAALLTIFAAAGAVSGEIESGVMHAVLARPVSRGTVLLGKYAGFAAMLVAYTLAMDCCVLLLARWLAGGAVRDVPAVLALMCLEPLLLLALTLLGGCRLSTLADGAAVLVLYGLGTLGGLVEAVGDLAGSRALTDVGVVSSLVVPADALYRKAVAVAAGGADAFVLQVLGPFGASAEPSGAMVVYALLYTAAVLGLAAWVFARRDV